MTRANNRLNPKFEESLKAAKENLKEIHVYRLEGGKKVSDRVMINRNWLPPWREFYRPIKDRSEEKPMQSQNYFRRSTGTYSNLKNDVIQ